MSSIQTATELKQADKAGVHTSTRALASSIGRNTLFGVAASVLQMGTRVVTVPIVIAYLGLDGYGIWSIIMTAAAHMRFGSAGVKSAFQKYVAEATGSNDYERTNRLISTGTLAMLILSLLALIPVAIFSRPLAVLAGVPDKFISATAGSISLLALIMVLANAGAAYEAIILGGHRIDIARKYNMIFATGEAAAIIVLLKLGYGLLAMSAVMATAEVIYVPLCYFTARRVLPEVHVSPRYLSSSVLRELITFGGSYQLVNVLEVLYAAILPITILKVCGADTAGIYGVVSRLTSAALMPHIAFLVPILSGSSMVFGTGSLEQMQLLLKKSFKATVGLAIFPLAFVAAYGTTIVLAWTGRADSAFRVTFWLMAAAGCFRALSSLGRVLYRASGKSLLDNIQQAVMILVLVLFSFMSRRLGYVGVLSGLTVAEFIGLLLMVTAVSGIMHGVHARMLIPDAVKLSAAILAVLVVGALVAGFPLALGATVRVHATYRLIVICLATGLAAWPALYLTKSISPAEVSAIRDVFDRNRHMKPATPLSNS